MKKRTASTSLAGIEEYLTERKNSKAMDGEEDEDASLNIPNKLSINGAREAASSWRLTKH